MRGTHNGSWQSPWPIGIIPACAGNTLLGQCVDCLHWGSSPRVRGTLNRSPRQSGSRGIIPACAGNTWFSGIARPPNRDHPRVCGEHHHVVQLVGVPQGSSPRVRGTRIRHVIEPAVPGIIPACAGNTFRPGRIRAARRDHPRVCGEHS